MSTPVPFSSRSALRSDVFAGDKRRVGSWRLTRQIGHGRLAATYLAQPASCSATFHSDYVIKMLRPQHEEDPLAIDLMRREVEIGGQVAHPHLVPILDSHVESAPRFIVMPRITGASIQDVIDLAGPISTPQALWVVRQTAEALQALHRQGWLHADVKPSNIVVSRIGHATLVDLGCALREDESIHAWDRPVVGTLEYIAPEMIRSRTKNDQRCDIYSLGVSLFQMVTGKLPFNRKTPQSLIESHLSEPAPDARSIAPVHEEVAILLKSMLAKEPLRRPQHAGELIERLIRLELETLDERLDHAA